MCFTIGTIIVSVGKCNTPKLHSEHPPLTANMLAGHTFCFMTQQSNDLLQAVIVPAHA